MKLRITKIEQSKNLTNFVYCSHQYEENPLYFIIKDYVFIVGYDDTILPGHLAMNLNHRNLCMVSLNELVEMKIWKYNDENLMSVATFTIRKPHSTCTSLNIEINEDSLTEKITNNFNTHPMKIGQKVTIDIDGRMCALTLINFETFCPEKFPGEKEYGIINKKTKIIFSEGINKSVNHVENINNLHEIYANDLDFNKLNIGGFNNELNTIFRRAFASRCLPSKIRNKLGIKHTKGMILYGPPGTGKTLIAKQVSGLLNSRPPKFISGSEILNKYVGQSEENIRNLFLEAEIEYQNVGEESHLHVIIIDEIDTICKRRSVGSISIGDSLVNQLLAKIDGPQQLNNVFIFGLTNRIDILDEAILRPGRLELHVEIGLPDKDGRLQILLIHTKNMRENNMLDKSVDLEYVSEITKNYSGAELESLVNCAVSHSLHSKMDINEISTRRKKSGLENIHVMQLDFEKALDEIKPSFGIHCNYQSSFQYVDSSDKIIEPYKNIFDMGKKFADMMKNSRTCFATIILEGNPGTGKTTIACEIAHRCNSPFTKIISPEIMVCKTEYEKCDLIRKTFNDAYQSPESIIIIDDLERIIEYIPSGFTFSNQIVQTLLTFLRKIPPKKTKLLVLSTTSSFKIINELGFMFDSVIKIPMVTKEQAKQIIKNRVNFDTNSIDKDISIKKLMMIIRMIESKNYEITEDLLLEAQTDFQ
jgi:vesicle-fusing ATPase